MTGNQFAQGRPQLLFATEDDILFLEVGGKGEAMQFRTRLQGAADVPGVHRTAEGAMHQVEGVGYRVEHYPRTAEHAGPLTDRASKAVFIAYYVKRGFTFDVNLIFTFF